MTKVKYPCVGGPGGACPSLCCYQAADALKSIVDLKLSGHPVDPAIFDFPYKVDEHGKCENVLDDGGCKVYLNRPLLCNIEAASRAMNLDPVIFMPANAEQCNAFMDAHLIPKEKQINIEKFRLELIDEWVANQKTNGTLQDNQRGTSGDPRRNSSAEYPLTPDQCYEPGRTSGDASVSSSTDAPPSAGKEGEKVQ